MCSDEFQGITYQKGQKNDQVGHPIFENRQNQHDTEIHIYTHLQSGELCFRASLGYFFRSEYQVLYFFEYKIYFSAKTFIGNGRLRKIDTISPK